MDEREAQPGGGAPLPAADPLGEIEDRPLALPRRVEEEPVVVLCLRVAGGKRDGPLEDPARLVEIAEIEEGRAEIALQVRVVGTLRRGLPEQGQGLAVHAPVEKGDAEIETGLRVAPVDFEGLPQLGRRLFVPFVAQESEAVLEPDVGVIGMELDGPGERLGGAREIAGVVRLDPRLHEIVERPVRGGHAPDGREGGNVGVHRVEMRAEEFRDGDGIARADLRRPLEELVGLLLPARLEEDDPEKADGLEIPGVQLDRPAELRGRLLLLAETVPDDAHPVEEIGIARVLARRLLEMEEGLLELFPVEEGVAAVEMRLGGVEHAEGVIGIVPADLADRLLERLDRLLVLPLVEEADAELVVPVLLDPEQPAPDRQYVLPPNRAACAGRSECRGSAR